ncbi:5-formyltetrahydrofolate cyclo-ligase [Sulfurimonas sp.]|nr:5-formyltetrahydrofolate cyclo-ligase [Sulfurimonas sp.]
MPLTKTIFRENCIKKMKENSFHNKIYDDAHLNQTLQRELSKFKNPKILLYTPMQTEVNIYKTLHGLRRKHEVYVPFMVGESFKMVPFRLPLKRKKFGIYEAGNSLRDINEIDIAVVPVVGVDGNLQRVGFGKGMYDRFFAKLKKRPYIIFVQSNLCYTKEFICDEYDVTCDVLIAKNVKIGNKNVKRDSNWWLNCYR